MIIYKYAPEFIWQELSLFKLGKNTIAAWYRRSQRHSKGFSAKNGASLFATGKDAFFSFREEREREGDEEIGYSEQRDLGRM